MIRDQDQDEISSTDSIPLEPVRPKTWNLLCLNAPKLVARRDAKNKYQAR